MTRFYVRRQLEGHERLAALAVAVGVGSLSFYLTRILLARENVESKAPAAPAVVGPKRSLRSLAQREEAEGC